MNNSNPEKDNRKPNNLISEKSPYLLQHAYNPVDWYPWRDEAFEKARKEDKPVFFVSWLFNVSLVPCNGN